MPEAVCPQDNLKTFFIGGCIILIVAIAMSSCCSINNFAAASPQNISQITNTYLPVAQLCDPPQSQGCHFVVEPFLTELLDDIWRVESSGRISCKPGDGGAAFGPMQIHADVLIDVNTRYDTNFTQADCLNITTAKQIAAMYITMWMEQYKSEIAARIYNGGPRGWRRRSTDKYWVKILNPNIAE